MPSFLPSKRFLITLSTVVVIAGVSFLLLQKGDPNGGETYRNENNTPLSVANVDTDNDGLKDWEEQLWKTDPNNPDTDADGTTDGEEVTSGRNPLVKGPGDTLDETFSFAGNAGNSTEPITQTEALARNFISEYLALKTSGGTLDANSLEALVNSLVKNIPKSKKAYVLKDISTNSTETKPVLREYGNKAGEALDMLNTLSSVDTSNTLIAGSSKENNTSILSGLSSVAETYSGVVTALLVIPAPISISNTHLRLINGITALAENTRAIQNVYEDPLTTIVALNAYESDANGVAEAINTLTNYFESNNILFTEGEGGYFFRR